MSIKKNQDNNSFVKYEKQKLNTFMNIIVIS